MGNVTFLRACIFVTLCAAALLATSTTRADGPTGLVIGGKLGGGIGKPLNESGASLAAEVELGYVLPPLDHAFELFSAFAYTAPSIEGSSTMADPRLPGDGKLHYRVDQQIGGLGLGLRYRLQLPVVTPYAAAGGRLYMTRMKVSGNISGTPIGTNQETGTAWGAFFAAGVEIGVGPGALLGELQINYGGFDGFVLRNTNLGSLGLMLGYRLMLPPPSYTSHAHDREDAANYAVDVAPVPPEPAPQSGAETTPQAAPAPEPAASEPVAAPAAVSADAAAAAPADGHAQVRGHVRSFSGEPLRATIRVKPRDLKASTDEQGYFELDVPPGKYTVHLRSNGYASQDRRVVVEPNGVTVLNVELGKK
jgi:hypothetical protein